MSKKQKERKKFKITKKLISALAGVLAVIFVGVSALFVIDSIAPANPKCYHKFLSSTFNGSYDTSTSPNKYWQVDNFVNSGDDGKIMTNIVFKYTPTNSKPVGKILINVSDLKSKTLDLTLACSTSVTEDYKEVKNLSITKKQVKNSNDGWIEIYNFSDDGETSFDSGKNYIRIGFSGDVRIREIFVLNTENNITSVSSDKIQGVYVIRNDKMIDVGENSVVKNNENSYKKIFDEQASQKEYVGENYGIL